jgi:hypothetical protein
MLTRILMGEGVASQNLSKQTPHPIAIRFTTVMPSPAGGEGALSGGATRGDSVHYASTRAIAATAASISSAV